MPPAATKKIATAIRSANRAIVNNYNAANRAINRAPAWVKWTVGIVAVAVILYVLWKLLFAGRKEGFAAAPDGYTKYENTDMQFCSDLQSMQSTSVELAAVECSRQQGCDGFTFDARDGKNIAYLKSFAKNSGKCDNGGDLQCIDAQGLVMYIKTASDTAFKGFCKGATTGAAVATETTDSGNCYVGNETSLDGINFVHMKFGSAYYYYNTGANQVRHTYNKKWLDENFNNIQSTFKYELTNYPGTNVSKTLIYNHDKTKILKVIFTEGAITEPVARFVDVSEHNIEDTVNRRLFGFVVKKPADNKYVIKWDGQEGSNIKRYALSTPGPADQDQDYITMKECLRENDSVNTCTFDLMPSTPLKTPDLTKPFYIDVAELYGINDSQLYGDGEKIGITSGSKPISGKERTWTYNDNKIKLNWSPSSQNYIFTWNNESLTVELEDARNTSGYGWDHDNNHFKIEDAGRSIPTIDHNLYTISYYGSKDSNMRSGYVEWKDGKLTLNQSGTTSLSSLWYIHNN